MGYGTAQGLPRSHFRRVDDVIARHGIDGDGWQRGIDQQVCGIAHAVTHRVGRRGVQGVVSFTQARQIGCRNRQAPATVRRRGGGVLFAVKRDGDGGAFRQINAGTAHVQILAFLHRIQHVIAAEGVEAN